MARNRQRKAEKRRQKRFVREKRAIAAYAKVPPKYRGNVWISKKPDGTTHIFFGGVNHPAGPSHGHYIINCHGTVFYRRNPFQPRGPHNYIAASA